MSVEDSDPDERTLYIGGITEKVTDKILYELFLQAGPLERVNIPKEKDGKNKQFAFVTFKHLTAVNYALCIFAGTKLFGRELILKNRNNSNSNRNSLSNQPSPMVLNKSFSNPLISAINTDDMFPQQYNMLPQVQQPFVNLNQQILQQQLLAMAQAQAMQFYGTNVDVFPSQRSDNVGSQRDMVDRNRYHRDEERNYRSKPYRRSRSRSPNRNNRDRSRSPLSSRHSSFRDKERDRDNRRRDNERGGGYQRWNHRK